MAGWRPRFCGHLDFASCFMRWGGRGGGGGKAGSLCHFYVPCFIKYFIWGGPKYPGQKRSGDPQPSVFSKSTAVQMGGVLPYKWEAYCSTNGRRTAGFPFLRSLEVRKVRRYKWGAYCRRNWRCTAVLFRQVVGVGVSETLPNKKDGK